LGRSLRTRQLSSCEYLPLSGSLPEYSTERICKFSRYPCDRSAAGNPQSHRTFIACTTIATAEELIQQCSQAASGLFPLAQVSVVYRASIAYVLQNTKGFIQAIQPLRTKQLSPLEVQALQRFNGLLSHFATILPSVGQKKWVNAVLNWPSTHIHKYVDGYRETLRDICKQLSLDPDKTILYDASQDGVNKLADLRHLKEALRGVRESAISCPNSVDVQQLIETRLQSIQMHLPTARGYSRTGRAGAGIPSTDAISSDELKQRMDKELAVFTSIDIPCEDLRLAESLGSGGFGSVFRAIRLSTSELLAVKEVRL
jgi:hypothetical protein